MLSREMEKDGDKLSCEKDGITPFVQVLCVSHGVSSLWGMNYPV